MIDLPPGFDPVLDAARPWLALLVVALMLAAFLRERFPPSVIAVAGAATFTASGLVSVEEATAVFSNDAPIAIAALFVLSGALVRTGALEAVASRVLGLAKRRPRGAVASLLGGTFASSAFMNNTPVVLVVTPVMAALARQVGVSPKRLLIPLSYVTILGGTCTLIGTSTNLLVAGMASARGAASFGIFDVTAVGLVTAAAGGAALLALGPLLLPRDGGEASPEAEEMVLTEARLREGAKCAGASVSAAGPLMPRGVRVLAVTRGAERIAGAALADLVLRSGDRLALRATEAELVTLAEHGDFDLGLELRALSSAPAERATMTIDANDPAVGSPLKTAPFLSRYPVRVIGASRQGHLAGPSLPELVVKAGDRLWFEATANTLRQLKEQRTLFVSGAPLAHAFRRERVAVAGAVMAGVVALAALGAAPISALAMLGVAIILVTRCLDAQEAWRAIDLDVLVLIFAMLVVGRGLEAAGTVALVVDAATPWLGGQSLFLVVLGLYALTSLLTELVTNNAVAVILTPVAISLSASLGVDPVPLILAVMFAASASFATPVGYQTNTLVYAAGGYKFADFLRVGVPMNLIVGLATCAAIITLHG